MSIIDSALTLLVIHCCMFLSCGFLHVDAQNSFTSSYATANQTGWYTSYSSVYNKTYSCWSEDGQYSSSYWSYTYFLYPSLFSYYYSSFYYSSPFPTMVTSLYYESSYFQVYKRATNSSIKSWSSSCDFIDKWTIFEYKCSNSYLFSDASCSQQNGIDGNEFWRKFDNGLGSLSYCKYSPISSSECQTFSASLGTWTNNEWNFYSANVTNCSMVTAYYKDNCDLLSISPNTYRANVSCSPYSVYSTSYCKSHYVYTSANIASNSQWSYFYVSETSCNPYYQWYSSCDSCGYQPSYYYDDNGYWKSTYYYNCSSIYNSKTVAPYTMNQNVWTFTSSCSNVDNNPVTYTNSNTTNVYYSNYQTNCQWYSYRESADYGCFMSTYTYSWCNDNYNKSYCSIYLSSYIMCDPYRITTYDVATHYTSCNTWYTYTPTCYTYTDYTYTTYGPITFTQYQPRSTYCYSYLSQIQNCYDCQYLTTPYSSCLTYPSYSCNTLSSTDSTCTSMEKSSFLYTSHPCSAYSSSYLTCTQMFDGSPTPSLEPNLNSSTFSSSSWARQWICMEGGKFYTTCNTCQYYLSYSYYPPYCSSSDVYSRNYDSSFYNYYSTVGNQCFSRYYVYDSTCSPAMDGMVDATNIPIGETVNDVTKGTDSTTKSSFSSRVSDSWAVTNSISSRPETDSTRTNKVTISDTTSATTREAVNRAVLVTSSSSEPKPLGNDATVHSTSSSTNRAITTLAATTKTTHSPTIGTTTTTSSTPISSTSSVCPTDYCLNNGNCTLKGCPAGYSPCCVCLTDYVGQRCESNRTFVLMSTLKVLSPFTSDLLDPSTELYQNYSNVFISLWYNVTISVYRELDDNLDSITINIVVSKFEPGSIIAHLITSGSLAFNNNSSMSTMAQASEGMFKNSLKAFCMAGTACAALNVDTSYITVNANPNVCNNSALNLCSTNAKCVTNGTIEYSCTCSDGYRDDSPSNRRQGSICTESCTSQKCRNGGSCKEVSNSKSECQCPWVFTGKYCDSYSTSGTVFIVMMCLGLALSVIVAFVAFKIYRMKQIRIHPELKIPINTEDEENTTTKLMDVEKK